MTHQIGYRRVSTLLQKTDRQLVDVELDNVFEDKISGRNTDRPQLAAMLKHLREGDTVNVHSIDRLARSMGDLVSLVEQITEKGCSLKFHKENLNFDGDASPTQTLHLNMMGAFAEFERSLIIERTAEGRAIAKAKGVKFGRKRSLTKKQTAEIRAELETGKAVRKIALDNDTSPSMVYRIKNEAR